MNYEPFTSIDNPTLAHFRHFSSLFTLSHLYICRESSTNQLLFMQNKPNVKDAQINVNSYMKSKYEKLDTWLSGKNKANSNPIKPNLKRAQMNVNLTLTKDYRKKDDFAVRINKPKTNPILSAVGGFRKAKMNLKSHHHPDNTCCIRKTQRII